MMISLIIISISLRFASFDLILHVLGTYARPTLFVNSLHVRLRWTDTSTCTMTDTSGLGCFIAHTHTGYYASERPRACQSRSRSYLISRAFLSRSFDQLYLRGLGASSISCLAAYILVSFTLIKLLPLDTQLLPIDLLNRILSERSGFLEAEDCCVCFHRFTFFGSLH